MKNGSVGHLLRRRLAQLGAEAVPDLGAEQARHPVEVALAVGVPQPAALAAADHRHLLGREAALAREVHHQMPLREVLQVGVVRHVVESFRWQRPCRPLDTVSNATGTSPPQRPHDPYTRRRTIRSSAGVPKWQSSKARKTEALLQKRDRYVARGVSIAPIFADHAHGARLTDADGREYIDFAGGIGVLNLGHTPGRGGGGDPRPGRAAAARLLPGGRLRPVPRGVPDAVRARARGPREEGAPDQLRRRGGRERDQDRPLPHRPRRGDHVRPRLPRPHAAHDVADVEARLQARHGPVRPRDLPRHRPLSVSRDQLRRRARGARLDVQGDGRPGLGGLRHPRAGAGRGRVHRHAARVHPRPQGALRGPRHPLHRRRGAGRHGPHRDAVGDRALGRRPRPRHRRQVARLGHAARGRHRPLRGDGLGAPGRARLDVRRQPGRLRRGDREPARDLERRVPRPRRSRWASASACACATWPHATR